MDRTTIIALALAASCGILLASYAIFGKTYSPSEQPRFVIVDNYEGCDVVRYTNHTDALYHYFLHCKQS